MAPGVEPVHHDVPRIGLGEPEGDAHGRRLARSVVPQEAVAVALAHVQGHALERLVAAVGLADGEELETQVWG